MSPTKPNPTWIATPEDFRLVLNLAADPIAGMDPGGRCLFCNPAMLDLLGLEAEEDLVGRDLDRALHGGEARGLPPLERGVLVPGRDGAVRTVDTWTFPLQREGRTVGALVLATGPQDPGPNGRIASAVAERMTVPLEYLDLNLGFLRKACDRFLRLLGLHRACMHHYPAEVAEKLRRAEAELDIPFFEGEVRKAAEESAEGLGHVAQALQSLRSRTP